MPDVPRAFAASANPAAPQPARAIRILLVDDHEDTLWVTGQLLTRCGYEVTAAGSITAALEAVASSENFDILITDIELPDGSGLDLLRLVRAQYPLKGIAVSGHAVDAASCPDGNEDFDDRFLKPLDFDRLNGAIRRAVAATS